MNITGAIEEKYHSITFSWIKLRKRWISAYCSRWWLMAARFWCSVLCPRLFIALHPFTLHTTALDWQRWRWRCTWHLQTHNIYSDINLDKWYFEHPKKKKKEKVRCSCSHLVTHPSTNPAEPGLTSGSRVLRGSSCEADTKVCPSQHRFQALSPRWARIGRRVWELGGKTCLYALTEENALHIQVGTPSWRKHTSLTREGECLHEWPPSRTCGMWSLILDTCGHARPFPRVAWHGGSRRSCKWYFAFRISFGGLLRLRMSLSIRSQHSNSAWPISSSSGPGKH